MQIAMLNVCCADQPTPDGIIIDSQAIEVTDYNIPEFDQILSGQKAKSI
jgi:hypothetical protein